MKVCMRICNSYIMDEHRPQRTYCAVSERCIQTMHSRGCTEGDALRVARTEMKRGVEMHEWSEMERDAWRAMKCIKCCTEVVEKR